MSFPKDLDEYTDDEIVAEFKRRLQCIRSSLCSYCNRPVGETPCKFPDRHEEPGAYSKDFMPRINGKFFRCDCGCNVFKKPKPVSQPGLFECNSCEALYDGK